MKPQNIHRWLLLFVLGASLLAPPAPAQQSVPGADPSLTPESAQEEQEAVFEIEIEEVTVPITVTDSSGEFVTDLNLSDFRVFDNNREQRISEFELSWEPISMVVVVETSSRVASMLPEIGRSGILFTQLILGESGEAAVIAFDSDVQVVQEFTDNPDLVENALKNLKPGAEDVRLSDALSRALFLLQRRPSDRRKVIVAISEARDNGSSNTPGFVLRGAQQLGISVYALGLSTVKGMFSRAETQAPSSPFPPGVMARPMPANQAPTPDAQARLGSANLDMLPIIEELVSYTKNLLGGNPLAFFAQGTGAEEYSSGGGEAMEQALSRIGRELRNQYLLTYRPNNLDKPGFHHIQVRVSQPDLQVRTRPGYLFTRPAGGGASSPPGAPSPNVSTP
jgi:VWFA-related protein